MEESNESKRNKPSTLDKYVVMWLDVGQIAIDSLIVVTFNMVLITIINKINKMLIN